MEFNSGFKGLNHHAVKKEKQQVCCRRCRVVASRIP